MRFPNRPLPGDAPGGRHDPDAGPSRRKPEVRRSLDPAITPASVPASG